VRTRQVRGALEHYYRATAHPWLDAEQWAQLPASFRRQILYFLFVARRRARV
jgi:hypothetical protein